MSYAEKLKDPRWQKKRLQVFTRDQWSCKWCGQKDKTLHVHHLEYAGDPWEVDYENLITLCDDCHSVAHFGLPAIVEDILSALYKAGQKEAIRLVVNIILQYTKPTNAGQNG